MAKRSQEDLGWFWLLKGFEGLFSMIDKWLSEGMTATPSCIAGLKEVHKKLGDKINALEDKQ